MTISVLRVGQDLTAFAFEAVTVDNTTGGVALTLTTHQPTAYGFASKALITVETAQIRFTYDGTAPTTTVGHILNAGDTLVLEGTANIKAARFIRTGGSSGTIQVTYERFRMGS